MQPFIQENGQGKEGHSRGGGITCTVYGDFRQDFLVGYQTVGLFFLEVGVCAHACAHYRAMNVGV